MASIRSVLIKNCMANVQKEISQLEHWLINLSDENESPRECMCSHKKMDTSNEYSKPSQNDIQNIYKSLENLSTMLSAQQVTIGHLVNRMEMIEDIKEVHIREQVDESDNVDDVWINEPSSIQQNEIVYDTLPEITYHVNKKDQVEAEAEDNPPMDTIQDSTNKDVSVPCETIVNSPVEKEELVVNQPVEKEKDTEEVVEEEKEDEVVEEVVEEEEVVKVEKEVEEVEDEKVVEVEDEKVVEEVEEEEEEEEEEEGVELEEIEFNGVSYYKDPDNLVYTIDEEGQPSEMAVGYWKEKSQSVVFYKTK